MKEEKCFIIFLFINYIMENALKFYYNKWLDNSEIIFTRGVLRRVSINIEIRNKNNSIRLKTFFFFWVVVFVGYSKIELLDDFHLSFRRKLNIFRLIFYGFWVVFDDAHLCTTNNNSDVPARAHKTVRAYNNNNYIVSSIHI